MRIVHLVTALLTIAAFVSQGTLALAGTTGGLTGSVVDAASSAPVAGAVVTVSSPSQTNTVTTDASGRFSFLTLAPDTYTVSVTKAQYSDTSLPGEAIFADTVQSVQVRIQKTLSTIAHVTAVRSGALVKSGTTADVYSVNAAQQASAAALGGGGSLNSAYSAVATVPGAYVIGGQMGYYQTVSIRGGDYDQVGYEFDGVPVNRSFDNYPSSSASSLGNSEVQVYTGANPADSQGQGLSGYINQVIRTGSYPGFSDASLGIATPTFYHRAMVEAGGATPDRLFSYYVGVAGYNQTFNYLNNQNGSQYDNWIGAPMNVISNTSYAPDPTGVFGGACQNNACFYPQGSVYYAAPSMLTARDVVMNFHIGIPHHNDAGRDDIQMLWDSESLLTNFYSTTNDIVSTYGCGNATNGTQCASALQAQSAIGLGVPAYTDSITFNCPSAVGQTYAGSTLNGIGKCVSPYFFPSSANRTSAGQAIPPTQSDTTSNNQEIVKLQYTKNFGSSAFLRIYGYSYYSNWFQNGPQTTYNLVGCCSPDYELNSHTRGGSIQFQDQINPQNLVSVQGDYVTASSVRDNNSFYGVPGENAAPIVSAANPYGGVCYTSGAVTANQTLKPAVCSGATATYDPTSGAQTGLGGVGFGAFGTAPSLAGDKCGTSACEYLLAENGQHATFNTITPKFVSTSITDEFRPTDKWLFNLGVRLDSFTFDGANTDYGAARDFWTNAFNMGNCVNNVSGTIVQKSSPLAACAAGTSPAFFQNVSAQSYTFNIWQPRISGTYTVNPQNVVRFSYGRYTQAPNSSFEQYNVSQEDLADYIGSNFYAFGRTTPGYPIAPPTSINYDLSWEHQVKGTDWSFKLTPFLRQTQGQIQNFFLDQKTGFVSGLNVGSQRSQGVEFQATKGDFSKNGIAGLLSFAYTNSYIKYGSINSGEYGTTVITGTNQAISNYNAYTAACAPGGKYVGKMGYNHVPLCGSTSNGVAAAPCYTPTKTVGGVTTGGQPVYTCTAADVGNPYWNNPQQEIDPGAEFATYDIFPGGVGSSNAAYGAPYVATLVMNYKHDKFAITPSLQFEGGGKYGAPQTNPGIDPAACSGVLTGPAGYNGGSRYNALDCGALSSIPDTYTGVFDPVGSFTQPNEISMNMQLSYDVSPRISLVGALTNIVNTCFGGTKAPWTSSFGAACSYNLSGVGGEINPVGNIYNPAGFNGSIVQPFRKYPYGVTFGPFNQSGTALINPFNFYVTAKIKL
jgi:Carboxypeptidase regulatory-like domain/TonB dependent receptor/TonB-dependent Receptor Plug Domain